MGRYFLKLAAASELSCTVAVAKKDRDPEEFGAVTLVMGVNWEKRDLGT